MDTKLLIEKAKAYLQNEENDHFKNLISNLLKDENWEELNECFYTDLSFGTGGLRGEIGGGTNRMNPYTVKKATQGFANYISENTTSPSAVIAYDSRNFSDLFALEAALVFCTQGIKTYLFSSLRPTPVLSFAVRELKATAGIVVTASHNQAQYNGYKAYWSDGAQIVPPHDGKIIDEVRAVKKLPKMMTKEEALSKGLLEIIDEKIDKPYMKMVKALAIRPQLLKEKGKDLKVAYTPLHGTGATMVPKVLADLGIEVQVVAEQAKPDGNFPTVKSPNPEEAAALKMVLELGKKIGADLVMGTDPDGDRLGIAVPCNDEFVLISGNQLGCLLADYIFSSRKELGTLPKKAAFVNTIVTSDLQRIIAESYGVTHYQTLTGFKYIGDKIKEFEENNSGVEYVFGGEESYGYLVGTSVRDKDAVSAALLTSELALYNLSQGRSILDHLNNIYKRFGYFQEALLSHTFAGQAGLIEREDMMITLRNKTPKSFGGINVSMIKDYQTKESINLTTKSRVKNLETPTSNVLQFLLEDGSIVTVRPSGTEPKIKFYISCKGIVGEELKLSKKNVGEKVDTIKKDILAIMPK